MSAYISVNGVTVLIKITLPVKRMLHECRGRLSSFTSTQLLTHSLCVNSIVLFVKWIGEETKLPWVAQVYSTREDQSSEH